ncbi:MAG: glycosyltransferase family 2 protein [Bacteroidaceae bacterium]|nr:glycosyltransferase family 2 protein [Bacteroidaceae bacterium]
MDKYRSYAIAAVLTCHNRREKTLRCLEALFRSTDNMEERPCLAVFLTDDGCTDGTAQAVQKAFPDRDIRITRSEDDLFWARGMCLSWRKAMEEGMSWDYYLLLNDDTCLLPDGLNTVIETLAHCCRQTGKEGLISGLTVSDDAESRITYGGMRWRNRWLGINEMVVPEGEPLPCDETNANILLVPRSVVERIGIFHDGYRHSCADYDYALMAGRHGIPSFVTGFPCGVCDFDHPDQWGKQKKLEQMTRAERRAYFAHPLTSSADHLLFVRRNTPLRYPLVWLGRWMNIYCPGLYNRLTGFRFKY